MRAFVYSGLCASIYLIYFFVFVLVVALMLYLC